MIKTSIEKLSKEIGYDIGQSTNDVQANLLNGFCVALKNSMSQCDLNTQISYIVGGLSRDTKQILKIFIEFINLNEREL